MRKRWFRSRTKCVSNYGNRRVAYEACPQDFEELLKAMLNSVSKRMLKTCEEVQNISMLDWRKNQIIMDSREA